MSLSLIFCKSCLKIFIYRDNFKCVIYSFKISLYISLQNIDTMIDAIYKIILKKTKWSRECDFAVWFCVHAQHICLLLVDEIVQRPRYRSQAVPNRIRSFGFPQHLHSIRVTRRGSSHKASCIFPYVFRQPCALAKARSRTATTCLPGEAATATSLIAIPRLETKWKISEYLPFLFPFLPVGERAAGKNANRPARGTRCP